MKTVSERLRRNANMCARVNAAVVLLCETALVGANEIERLEKQRDELLAALKDAATSMETLAMRSFGESSLLDDKSSMRQYSASRAGVARAAIAKAGG